VYSVDVPLVEFMYLVFTRMPGENYRRRLRSLLYLYYVFPTLRVGMGVWEEPGRLYTYRYIVTTRITPALRRAAMRGHCNVSVIVRDKVTTRQVSTNHNFFEEKGEPKRNQDDDVDRA